MIDVKDTYCFLMIYGLSFVIISSQYNFCIFPLQVKDDCISNAALSPSSSVQMMTVPMSFSMFQGPRFRIHTLANFWNGSFQSWTRRYKTNAKLHDSRTQGLEGTSPKKWTRRPLTTNTEGSKKTARSSKASSITQEILDGTVSTTTNLNITKTAMGQYQKIQHYDIRLEIAKNKDLANLVTIITFDIETTGLSRENDRIVEIGVQDLRGGKDSTFETLVNPERYVGNADVHQITSCMVNRPDVPRYCGILFHLRICYYVREI